MAADPIRIINEGPMHWRQIVVVAVCIVLNALDGFDVLAISFAAPGIAEEWGIDRDVLGVVLSMELIGMAAGSVLIGNLADRLGRRPVILGCLGIMTSGMFLATQANSVEWLSAARLYTGIGIGGMLSSTSAMVAEFSNSRRRSLNMVLNIAGYSTGAILGGLLAAQLLEGNGDWRNVFYLGGALTLAAFPLAWFYLPESIDSLLARRPANALEKINSVLVRLGHSTLQELPARAAHAAPGALRDLFQSRFARPVILLTMAYFAQIMLFYYVQKWIPKIVVDMGYDAAQAGRVLVAANVGNLTSAILIGLASQRVSLRPMVIATMIAGFLAIGLFGTGPNDLVMLSLSVALAAFFINAGVVGMYPLMGECFPAGIRASGIGFVIGVGRGGSAVGPVLAGTLFAQGGDLLTVSLVMGAGGLVAALMILLLKAPGGRSPA